MKSKEQIKALLEEFRLKFKPRVPVLVYGDISIYYLEPSSVPEILEEFIKIRAVPLVFFKEFPVLLLFRVEGSEHSLFYSKELNIYLAMSDLTGEEEVLLKKEVLNKQIL